jgi:aminoglycoside 2'-N-acetyltransferase I
MTVVTRILESRDMDTPTRLEARRLWDRAFGARFDDNDAEHAFGGVHVLAFDGERLIGHAAAVPRRLKFGDQEWRDVGYVEAVAVDPDHQGRGVGRHVMQALHAEVASRWPIAMLSTGRATSFYAGLGWERWGGRSFTLTAAGDVVADDEHGGLMILRIDPSAVPDLCLGVTCEDRSGDAW